MNEKFKCSVEKCFGHGDDGYCKVLEKRTKKQKRGLGCPFYKSKEQYRREVKKYEA